MSLCICISVYPVQHMTCQFSFLKPLKTDDNQYICCGSVLLKMSLKQRTIKFQPRIKLSHNIVYTKQKLIFILTRETSGFTVLSFFFKQYFGNFNFNVQYCGIIQPCGMWFFIFLADDIRWKKILHGIAVSFYLHSPI